MQLEINRNKNIVTLQKPPTKGYYNLGTISCALGNIIEELKKIYPSDDYFSQEYIVNSVFNSKDKFKICEFPVHAGTLIDILDYLRNHTVIDIESVELFRIMHNVRAIRINPKDTDCFLFKNISSINDLIYSLLYYHAMNKERIKQCVHCHRWFATHTLKENYCSRKSPMKEYNYLDCHKAVKTCKAKLSKRKKAIENAWYHNHSDKTLEMYKETDKLNGTSAEDLLALEKYLYSEDKPKQTRPNRKSKKDKGE